MKKLYNLLLLAFAAISAIAQPCDRLFFSEYLEGSSNNKALEIYNPTTQTINLLGYKVQLYTNGSATVNTTFNLNATIAAGGTYVIANNQSDSLLKLKADTVSGVTNFNGNDAVALVNGSTIIDVIGVIGIDPGNQGWPVGTGATINYTLIRNDTVQRGNVNWQAGAEWSVLPLDSNQLRQHTGPTVLAPCAPPTVDTMVAFSTIAYSFTGVNGNFNLNLSVSTPHTDSFSVEVQVQTGLAAWINNFTTQTVTFPTGVNNRSVPVTITNDTTGGLGHTLTFVLRNSFGGLDLGADSVFTLTLSAPVVLPPDTCATLFFSEYVEGSSNNKALEIYNPTANSVDLTGYKLQMYSNGGTTPSNTFNLPGSIAAGDVYVIVNSQASDTVMKSAADTLSGFPNFTGNDAVALLYYSDTLDVIGVIGESPASGNWPVGSGNTTNHTLVRDASVKKGTKDWAVSATLWTVYGTDTAQLGSHTGPVNQNACTLVSSIANEPTTVVGKIYPNPNNGNFTIQLENGAASADVKVFDLNGKLVYAGRTLSINASSIAAGMYVVEVGSSGNVSRTKITVQK